MHLETARLILRPFNANDLRDLSMILTDPQTMQHWPQTPTQADAQTWLQRNIDHYNDHGFSRYAVILKTTNQLIGDCGIINTTLLDQPVHDLGYIIAATHWRHGYALEAGKQLLEHGFNQHQLAAIHANMSYNHYGSQRVAERLNMQRVATFNNPRNRDYLSYIYRITEPEYRQLNESSATTPEA